MREAVDYEQVVEPSVELPCSVNDSESGSTFDGCSMKIVKNSNTRKS